jgi:tRNA pseudouridine38-40 synthase
LRLVVEYDGTDFCGFQWQPSVRTVAGVLEAALGTLFDEPVKVTGAGRTDSGVHASGQVVSLSTAARFPYERLAVALRGILPSDLSVRQTDVVEEGFSARFSARRRTYVYAILNRGQPSALLNRYCWHVARPLDFECMRDAGTCLVGEHDFRSFAAAAAEERTLRTVFGLQLEPRGELVRVEIAADGFLHHMVRTIVGTLVECGTGRRDPAGIPGVLAACDRSAAGLMAPAAGLYLAGIRYAGGYDSFAEPPIFRPASP